MLVVILLLTSRGAVKTGMWRTTIENRKLITVKDKLPKKTAKYGVSRFHIGAKIPIDIYVMRKVTIIVHSTLSKFMRPNRNEKKIVSKIETPIARINPVN